MQDQLCPVIAQLSEEQLERLLRKLVWLMGGTRRGRRDPTNYEYLESTIALAGSAKQLLAVNPNRRGILFSSAQGAGISLTNDMVPSAGVGLILASNAVPLLLTYDDYPAHVIARWQAFAAGAATVYVNELICLDPSKE